MTQQALSNPELTGGCQCGAVRYCVSGAPRAVYVCHCRECQKQSSSAFGVSVYVERSDFSLLSGSPRSWSRPADSGRIIDCVFCPQCGSRVWHEGGGGLAEFITIKGGSLDQPVDLCGVTHVWTSRKLPGVVIPEGSRSHAENPD